MSPAPATSPGAASAATGTSMPSFGGIGVATVSFPLLEGLVVNQPNMSDAIVEKAFRQWDAGRRIGRFIARKLLKQRKPTSSKGRARDYQHHHWLFRNLSSPSRLERQAASRILSQGSVLTEHRHWQLLELYWGLLVQWIERNESTYWNISIDESCSALEWLAMLKHIVLLPSFPSVLLGFALGKGPRSAFKGGVTWLCEVIWKLSSCLLPQTSTSIAPPSPNSYVPSGSSLVHLAGSVQSLSQQGNAGNVPMGEKSNEVPECSHLLNMTSRGAIQRILIALIDLVDCLVLHGVETTNSNESTPKPKPPREPTFIPGVSTGTVSQHVAAILANERDSSAASSSDKSRRKPMTRLEQLQKVHKYLWAREDESFGSIGWKMTPSSHPPPPQSLYNRHHTSHRMAVPLSPLACLIGAYHLLSLQMSDPMGPYPTRSMVVCCTLLQKLVDPASVPKVVLVPIEVGDTAKDTSGPKPRLITTFDVSMDSDQTNKSPGNSSESTKRKKNKKNKVKRKREGSSGAAATSGTGSRNNNSNDSQRIRLSSMAAESTASSSDRLAAAAVARIFSVVYGGGDNPEGGGDDAGEHKDDGEEDEDDDIIEGGIHRNGESDYDLVDDMFMNEAGEDDNTLDDDHHDHDDGDEQVNDGTNNDHVQSMDVDVGHDHDDLEEGGIHHDHDDEIDSDVIDGEDDDDEGDNDEDDDEIDDDDDEELVGQSEDAHDIMLDRFQDGLIDFDGMDAENVFDIVEPQNSTMMSSSNAHASPPERPPTSSAQSCPEKIQKYKRSYVQGCMEVLLKQHPVHHSRHAKPVLTFHAEQELLTSIMNIVKPPKKPVNTKIIMRRAPTQEEFFRGSLSRNPISLSMLQTTSSGPSAPQEGVEPTFGDLRQHIANDLQMGDSAEMLELLVAGKIIDISLKLRVVHQVVWKNHLMENSGGGGSGGISSFLSGSSLGARGFALSGGGRVLPAGSGLSMLLSSSFGERSRGSGSGSGRGISADTPLSSLPPMVVTYRLTGVDGEATEDTVTTLEDPEAPSDKASPQEVERLMEKEYGITRLVTKGRGVHALLRSVEKQIRDTLRRIRRDDVGLTMVAGVDKNQSRAKFKQDPPYPGLSLLWCCSKLPSNRKMLLEFRAPTILLRLLLNVLHSLDVGPANSEPESNATAKILQELIEVLATDISIVSASSMQGIDSVENDEEDEEDIAHDAEQDASTLRLLLSSIETTQLSASLRNVIAKLLPYLTYGQVSLSRELALDFVRHVEVGSLADGEAAELVDLSNQTSILMDTFVQTSISLPPNEVCNSLRSELVACGFVDSVASFFLRELPNEPPPWSTPLWAKGQVCPKSKRKALETEWRIFINRLGLRTALKMLIGLSKRHAPTQLYLANWKPKNSNVTLLQACHWMEATSDYSTSHIHMNGLGLTAETLLDELIEGGDANVSDKVKAIRRKTRNRKKEIAMARRNKALVKIGSFGSSPKADRKRSNEESTGSGEMKASNDEDQPMTTRRSAKRRKTEEPKEASSPDDPPKAAAAKPAWMTEMENMEDETGLTCAVCQEGRTLQPSELLGLYAYVKKVSIPSSQCGGRPNIDGTVLLKSLPSSLPDSLLDIPSIVEWFAVGRAAGEDLSDNSFSSMMSSSSSSGRRATYFTTTVSAGNAIHISCHEKARHADRNHPKAPKSEWEGASLRNSRVNCNVILPLVSSRSSKVPLVAVDGALTDHQTAVSNLLGARPKSMLWTVLHDVRLLLLRVAYGEALNTDCGGGSLASNAQLVFYQLLSADMFEKDAQIDAPEMSQHARGLSAGFLAARAIVTAEDRPSASSNTSLMRAISDSATMASLTCVLFHNVKNEFGTPEKEAASGAPGQPSDRETPHPKRRWMFGRESFLRGLINCAGRRHALGVDISGCVSGRAVSSTPRNRSSGFASWDDAGDDSANDEFDSLHLPLIRPKSSGGKKASIEDFRNALRPMFVYYAMMEQLSSDFVLNMDDVKVEECANRLVDVIEECHSAKGIEDLLSKAKITLSHDEIVDEFQKGMIFS